MTFSQFQDVYSLGLFHYSANYEDFRFQRFEKIRQRCINSMQLTYLDS